MVSISILMCFVECTITSFGTLLLSLIFILFIYQPFLNYCASSLFVKCEDLWLVWCNSSTKELSCKLYKQNLFVCHLYTNLFLIIFRYSIFLLFLFLSQFQICFIASNLCFVVYYCWCLVNFILSCLFCSFLCCIVIFITVYM
jgi:hypothetical protein